MARQRLIEHLAAGDEKLAVVHAPAGFGKTIAVAQWRAAEIEDRAYRGASGGSAPARAGRWAAGELGLL